MVVGTIAFGVDQELKIRSIPFIPTLLEITAEEAGGIQGLEAVISHWAESAWSAEGWFEEVARSWGPAGFVMRRGEQVLGYAVYGPQRYLPRAGRYPVGPLDEDTPLLAYLKGDARARRHLLVRVLRDLRLRGFGGVEAVASDAGLPRHVPTRFLMENGWKPVRRGWCRGCSYTLMRADFDSVVEVGELARELVGWVKLPVLKAPSPTIQASVLAPAVAKVPERRS